MSGKAKIPVKPFSSMPTICCIKEERNQVSSSETSVLVSSMEEGSIVSSRRSRFSPYERLVAIGLAIVAVASPLFINWRSEIEDEDEGELINFAAWLPLLLFMLIFAIAMSPLLDRSFARFDPYWIHRVGGSSGGIIFILVVLALILKWKA